MNACLVFPQFGEVLLQHEIDTVIWGAAIFCGATVVGLFAFFLLRDVYRFGRRGILFPYILGLCGLVSAVGFVLGGALAAAISSPVLVLYGIGWWRFVHDSRSRKGPADAG